MAVYVPVSSQQVRAFLNAYSVGKLIRYLGISEGMSNSNYFVETTNGRFVLTITDNISQLDVDYIFGLTQFLSSKGIPSVQAVKTTAGRISHIIHQQLAILSDFLPGASVTTPTLAQCEGVGHLLVNQHTGLNDYSPYRANPFGLGWLNQTAKKLTSVISEKEQQCLFVALGVINQHDWSALPKGTIHADCFRDNILFVGEQITGVLDFYFACDDCLILDLATAAVDWCQTSDGYLDNQKVGQLLNAYQQGRVLTAGEKASWSISLTRVALRFWLGRLLEKHFPRPCFTSNKVTNKSPDVMHRLLEKGLSQAPFQHWPNKVSDSVTVPNSYKNQLDYQFKKQSSWVFSFINFG